MQSIESEAWRKRIKDRMAATLYSVRAHSTVNAVMKSPANISCADDYQKIATDTMMENNFDSSFMDFVSLFSYKTQVVYRLIM